MFPTQYSTHVIGHVSHKSAVPVSYSAAEVMVRDHQCMDVYQLRRQNTNNPRIPSKRPYQSLQRPGENQVDRNLQ